MLATFIARHVTPDPDSIINVGALTRYDLYCFAFVFLGLYFVLSSLAQALNAVHFHFAVSTTIPPPPQLEKEASLYRLAAPLITLVAGVLCIVFSSRLSRKLTGAQHQSEAAGA